MPIRITNTISVREYIKIQSFKHVLSSFTAIVARNNSERVIGNYYCTTTNTASSKNAASNNTMLTKCANGEKLVSSSFPEKIKNDSPSANVNKEGVSVESVLV
jgi:hypothetical protein